MVGPSQALIRRAPTGHLPTWRTQFGHQSAGSRWAFSSAGLGRVLSRLASAGFSYDGHRPLAIPSVNEHQLGFQTEVPSCVFVSRTQVCCGEKA